jgi:hypothetical protein
VWLPSARPRKSTSGAQGAKAAPSRLHSKVTPESGEDTVKVASRCCVGLLAGPPARVVSGAWVSTLNWLLAELSLPARSREVTATV